jgi:3-oxoacyl-[acyl-carrier-protein] synthase II
MAERVVVTGLGVCSPVGTGLARFWDSLVEGRSGIGPITAFDPSNLRSRIAGEVTDCDLKALLPRKLFKRTARFTQLALIAAREAIAMAELENAADRNDAAVVIGTGIGGVDLLEREHQVFLERGPGKFNPLAVPMVIPNMAAGTVAMETGFRGPNVCLSTACATGAHSIGTGLDLIRLGRADTVLAGSSESTISPYSVDGYSQLRALSTRNDDPTTASRPFSLDRDGFVIAEGAALLVLESWSHAQARGAKILAELVGYGATADGFHFTAPDPEGGGAIRAMTAALKDAGIRPDDVDVVNAHGTSTPLNDATETMVIKRVFGSHAGNLAVHATKSMTGHALGASASIEAVVSVLTLLHQVIHPTINLQTPDPECDLDYVPNVARPAEVSVVMSNSFAFGGQNAVLIFRKA